MENTAIVGAVSFADKEPYLSLSFDIFPDRDFASLLT